MAATGYSGLRGCERALQSYIVYDTLLIKHILRKLVWENQATSE